MSDTTQTALSRRDFIALTALGTVGLAMPRIASAADAEQLLYVGTYTAEGGSKGIYTMRLSRTGAMRIVGLAAETNNPSFVALSPNGKAVYAVNEVGELDGQPTGEVGAFARTRRNEKLRALSSQLTGGADPCYLTTDRSGRFLLVANYSGGSVASFPILSDGGIGSAASFIQHTGRGPDPDRQASPHAHCIIPDPSNRFVLVADLGVDRVFVYAFDHHTGKLSAVAGAGGTVAPGAGPRHLAFHPNGHLVYVTNELDSTITAFRYDALTGALTALQTVPSVSEPVTTRNAPADIHVHPSGRFLYMSNRGHNSIAAFTIDQASGALLPLQLIATGGDWPRNFAIDPRGEFLLVANQRSDTITSFRIDRESGRLTATGRSANLAKPVCLRFVPAGA